MSVTYKTDDEQRARWNGPAGRAWLDAQESLDRLFKPFEDLLVEVVTAGPRGQVIDVLDVGCGTGGTTVAVARRLGTKGRPVGVDISDAMIAAARTRAEREGTPAAFVRANAQDYAFQPKSFDMIMSRFGVMFFDDPVRAFANLRRAARDGGTLRFVAWRSVAENPFMTMAERAAAPLLPNLPARKPDAPGQFAFAKGERVHSILKESGWADIEIQPVDVDCCLPEKELIGYLTRLGPVGLILQEADDRTRARVIETVRAAFDSFVHGSDVRFSAACWMVGSRAV